MAEYHCPNNISALFDDDSTRGKGREQAARWVKELGLVIGDIVWLPELGRLEKTTTELQ